MSYRAMSCPHCGRNRVESNGVCEKCFWDADGGNFASITRPTEYDVQGEIYVRPNGGLFLDPDAQAPPRPVIHNGQVENWIEIDRWARSNDAVWSQCWSLCHQWKWVTDAEYARVLAAHLLIETITLRTELLRRLQTLGVQTSIPVEHLSGMRLGEVFPDGINAEISPAGDVTILTDPVLPKEDSDAS